MNRKIKRYGLFIATAAFYVLGFMLEVDPMRIDSGVTAGVLVFILMEMQNDD